MKIISINNYQPNQNKQSVNFEGFKITGLLGPKEEKEAISMLKELAGKDVHNFSLEDGFSQNYPFWRSSRWGEAWDDYDTIDITRMLTDEQRVKLLEKGKHTYLSSKDECAIVDEVEKAREDRITILFETINNFLDNVPMLTVKGIRESYQELKKQQAIFKETDNAIEKIRKTTCKNLGIDEK